MEASFRLELPSRGMVYPPGTAIMIRPLLGKDERLMSELTQDNFEVKFAMVLAQVVTGLPVGALTLGDRLFIICWLIANSYTSEYPFTFNCPQCRTNQDLSVNLKGFDIVELPPGFKEPFPVKLSGGQTANLRLFRVEDEVAASDFDKSGESSWLYRYARSVVSPDDVLQRISMLEQLPAQDLAKIRAFQEEFFHGPRMESGYTCTKCGRKGSVRIPITLEFLFPYGAALRKTFGDAIRLGVLHQPVQPGPDAGAGPAVASRAPGAAKT